MQIAVWGGTTERPTDNEAGELLILFSSMPHCEFNETKIPLFPDISDDSLPVGVHIKDEPQTVPNSPSFSPVDMDEQERQKLERKRQRNRVAASKCRKRKLERISKLEDKVKLLKGENSELGSVVMNLKQHVMQLKQQILEHVNAGCRIPFQQF